MSEWISVKDELPRIGKRVIIFTSQPLEASRYEGNKFNRFGVSIDYATHWMELPEAPKTDTL